MDQVGQAVGSLHKYRQAKISAHAGSLSNVRLPFTAKSPSETSSRSVSPITSSAGRRSPFQVPARSQTTPVLSERPPSDDAVIEQSRAYPHFNTEATKSDVSLASPLDAKPAFARTKTEPIRSLDPQPQPLQQDINRDVDGVLHPSGDISQTSINSAAKRILHQEQGHLKTTSMGSSRDFSRPVSSSVAKFHTPRPSGSSSVYTRNRSMSTISGASKFDWDTPDVPSVPSITGRESPAAQTPGQSPAIPQNNSFDFGLDKPKEDDSPTIPSHSMPKPRPDPSPYSHNPRPSVTAAMAPLDSIGSFKPAKSVRGRKASIAATPPPPKITEPMIPREDRRLQEAPPVPSNLLSTGAASGTPASMTHTPNESTSSNGSYSSGGRSGSSRSSPPLQESPRKERPVNMHTLPAVNSFNDFQFGVETSPHRENPPSSKDKFSKEQDLERRKYYSRVPSLSTQPTLPILQPDLPPTDHQTSPTSSPDDYMISSNKDGHSQPHQFHLSPTTSQPTPSSYSSPPSPQPPPRSKPPDKGPCRGCGEPIKGKSVSSADGRLTGRYHKGCFVCTTCGNPFLTADFYVLRNYPYCARHYHELNDSLCYGCDRGIEGQYLETETYRKFHSYCFSCQECHKILRDDYYEWGGRTLCEQHAFKAANQPSSSLGIGGGRRFPERRTTKLMMM